ncbi:hypothetical protein [Asticcacaulis tiandongensis]|uniref:hypothetical protein n=1 Tax=Asticcacaulis tiandongensis TaxID=2565365 RepID=UPI00112938C5|nr:hypothetical protein [Asticcacaulis tiandongensis]
MSPLFLRSAHILTALSFLLASSTHALTLPRSETLRQPPDILRGPVKRLSPDPCGTGRIASTQIYPGTPTGNLRIDLAPGAADYLKTKIDIKSAYIEYSKAQRGNSWSKADPIKVDLIKVHATGSTAEFKVPDSVSQHLTQTVRVTLFSGTCIIRFNTELKTSPLGTGRWFPPLRRVACAAKAANSGQGSLQFQGRVNTQVGTADICPADDWIGAHTKGGTHTGSGGWAEDRIQIIDDGQIHGRKISLVDNGACDYQLRETPITTHHSYGERPVGFTGRAVELSVRFKYKSGQNFCWYSIVVKGRAPENLFSRSHAGSWNGADQKTSTLEIGGRKHVLRNN